MFFICDVSKEILSWNGFSYSWLTSAALLLKVDKKIPLAFVSCRGWSLVCWPRSLSTSPPGGSQEIQAEVDVLHFPGISIFFIIFKMKAQTVRAEANFSQALGSS